MHPYVEIGSLSLPSYGLCALVGTIIAMIVLYFLRKKSTLSEDDILDALIWAIILGMVGSKTLYFITDPPTMPESWSELWDMLTAGLVFYGALIGGLLGVLLVSLKKKKNFFTFTDLILPCFCFAHAAGRIGCLMAGCCFGIEAEGFLCFTLNGVSRLGTQVMEAMFLTVLGILLVLLFNSRKLRRGAVSGWYMVLYAVWRFIIEFYRDDFRGNVGALSTSQFISIFIFAGGVVLLVLSRKWPFEQATAAVEEKQEKILEAVEETEETEGTDEEEEEELREALEMAEAVAESPEAHETAEAEEPSETTQTETSPEDEEEEVTVEEV